MCCVICLSNLKTWMIFPCNHLVFCEGCKDNYLNVERNNKCPICK